MRSKERTEEKKVTLKEESLQERPEMAGVVGVVGVGVGTGVVRIVVLVSTWSSSYS